MSTGRAHHRASAPARAALLALGCALCPALACSQAEPPRVTRLPATIRARSPDGLGVAGVRVWADGRELGTTDAEGQLGTTLEGKEGARVAITSACPPAYRTLDERRELTMRRLHATPNQPTASRLQLTLTCEPLELLTALVVRIRGELTSGLPIRVRDQVVGQTGPDGTAHLVLRTRPDASLTVELDTSAEARLAPINPVQTFQLGKEPSVLVFDQTLTRPRAARRGLRPARLAAPTRGLPYRVN